MNPQKFIAILRARWVAAATTAGVVMLATILYVVFAPRTYVATASLLIDVKPDPVSSMIYGTMISPSQVNNQLEIIDSDRVARRVIQNLKLTGSADLRAMYARSVHGTASMEDWLVDVLLRGLETGVARPGSNVVNVGFRATDPQFAANIANAWVQAYLETAIEVRVDPARQYSGFFTDQTKAARDALEAAQSRLSDYQKAHGIVGTDDRYDIEMNRLTLLTQELVNIQTQRADASAREGQARRNESEAPDVLSSGLIGDLKQQLSSAEIKLQELSAKYGDKHPQVVDARDAVADLKARIASETAKITGGLSATTNATRVHEAEARAALEEQRRKVLELKAVRDQNALLAREVESAQRAYDQVTNRAAQTTLESRNLQSDSTVISQAAVPASPASPKVLANLLMGFVAALGLGVGVALVLEHLDRRVRILGDAMDYLGLPVIGVMPSPTLSRRLRGRAEQLQNRVISGRRLAAPEKGQA